jgi:hypothetical protein
MDVSRSQRGSGIVEPAVYVFNWCFGDFEPAGGEEMAGICYSWNLTAFRELASVFTSYNELVAGMTQHIHI